MFSRLAALLLRPLLLHWSRKARPGIRGATVLPGLSERVKVFRDPYGVPHLFASNERDLFTAQGYIHAQERLWQMDLTRRFLTGRLAEILGEKTIPWRELSVHLRDKTTVDLDYFVRLVGLRRTACSSLRLLPPTHTDLLVAYSEGVNRYVESHLKALPVEFRILRYHPDPWRPEDTLTIGKGFALLLSTSLFTRLTFHALSERLKGQEAKIRSLAPGYPDWGLSITRYRDAGPSEASSEILRFINGTFGQSPWAPAGHGSNSWAIAPWRSASGRPILCNDPHLRMSLPPIWYLNHLRAEPMAGQKDGYHVVGASIPGSPCVQLGHNCRIAWGVTAALCDDVDLYREKLHPHVPHGYLAGNEWKKMECQEEKIRIRGGRQVNRTVRFTRHGPVLTDLTQTPSNGEVLALRWTAHEPGLEMRALYDVNRARDWKEFLDGLSHHLAPTLNYVYADANGNIGYSLAGRVPLRPGPPSLFPLPGWNDDFEWNGHVPFNELPRLYNPPEGMVATANNRIADPSYPHYLSDLFDAPYRIQRIRDLLNAKEKLSTEDMVHIQADVVSVQARELIDVLRPDLTGIAEADPSLRETVERLIRWDGNCSAASPEAGIFHVLYHRLMVNLLAPDLGQDLLIAYSEIYNQSLVPTDQILKDPGSPWFASRSRRAVVETSVREARDELAAQLGESPDEWSWGKLHTLTMDHPMGRIEALASYFSIGPFPASGDGVTINSGFYRHSNPYRQVVGPSLRMVLIPGEWERCRFVLPSGQSGHPRSPHYRDQVDVWRRGDCIQVATTSDEMTAWPTLTLTPRGDAD